MCEPSGKRVFMIAGSKPGNRRFAKHKQPCCIAASAVIGAAVCLAARSGKYADLPTCYLALDIEKRRKWQQCTGSDQEMPLKLS